MVAPTCSKCGREIPPEDINVARDVAYCRVCNLASKLSEITQSVELQSEVDFANPPRGAWRQDDGLMTIVGAKNGSIGSALGILFFALFWNGITSVFVAIAIAGTLHNLGIPQPSWFPAPNMNGEPMGVGMNVFMWLFLTPFILIGAGMAAMFLLLLAGRTEITLGRNEASVFTGVGPIGYRKRFDPQTVTSVRVMEYSGGFRQDNSGPKYCIAIDTTSGKQIKCGTLLNDERRKFLAASLSQVLVG